jgi:antitoxin HigA-1
MVTHDPAHPGELIRSFCLNPRGLTVTEAANSLGVSRKALWELLNGRTGVSRTMALRLARVFNTSAKRWMAIQEQYDLWRAREAVNVGLVQQFYEENVGK